MIPLLPYFLSYVGGILAAVAEYRNFIFPYLTPAMAVAAAMMIFRKSAPVRGWKTAAFILLFPVGFIMSDAPQAPLPEDHILFHIEEGRPARIEGQLRSSPQTTTDQIRYTLDLQRLEYGTQRIPVTGRVLVTLYHKKTPPTLTAGDLVRIDKVRLKRPRNFKNPGHFDYEAYLAAQGITVIGNVSPPGNVEQIGSVPLPLWISVREALYGKFVKVIEAHFPAEEKMLLKGMILGDKQSLSAETREAYIATGLAHLMAVSGLHIGFVAGAAFFLLSPIVFQLLYRISPDRVRAGHARKWTAFLCLFPVLIYMLLVGAKVSALRAGIMVIAVLIAILLNREKNLFNALLVAAFLILLWNPKALGEVGFQLSFMAVFSILYVFHHLFAIEEDPVDWLGEPSWFQKLVKGYPGAEEPDFQQRWTLRLQRIIAGSTLVSLAAMLGTLPILLFHFNRISLAGFFLNPFMVPLASVLIPLALLAITAGILWPPLLNLLGIPVSLLLKLFSFIPQLFSPLPWSSIYLPTPAPAGILFYYFLYFGGIYFFCRKPEGLTSTGIGAPSLWLTGLRKKLFAAGLALALLGTLAAVAVPRFSWGDTETLAITVLDVGQGESIFIEFPNHKTLLIDGGGFYKSALDVGRAVVAPFLWNRGLAGIDFIAATHSDNDHISGLESLLDIFPVRHYLDHPAGEQDPRIREFYQKARNNRAIPLKLKNGVPLSIGEVRLIPLLPETDFFKQEAASKHGKNNLSLVLRLEYREFSMLLTGDIETEAEAQLLSRSASLPALFLKAPHHGSRFSNTPEFIQAVHPQTVIFSAGHLNPWRHPDPEVLLRYQTSGARIWRTDLHGAIQITTDGTHHSTQSYLPRQLP